MPQRIVIRAPASCEWLVFADPLKTWCTTDARAVPELLAQVERDVHREHLFAAGLINYEAAPGFDPAYEVLGDCRLPLFSFGLFPEPQRLSVLPLAPVTDSDRSWTLSIERSDYLENIHKIKREIQVGNTYQVNYTTRLTAEEVHDPWSMFLGVAVDAPYAAYIESEDYAIACASPELLFQRTGDFITSRPMKGTAGRGVTHSKDTYMRDWLAKSPKNRAENIMITDMVRNDLGRIAKPGTVRVADLCSLEKYRTVWQLTSTVTAESSASIAEIVEALFPAASVTGAPKVSSMRIIADLEDTPREIYTGTIGYLAPTGDAQFNVAIRTSRIDKRNGAAVYGVGGGIVADSEPEQELRECLTKSKVIRSRPWPSEFELLETMLWRPEEGFVLLDRHIERLRQSAEYFDFPFQHAAVERTLSEVTESDEKHAIRVRLLLNNRGRLRTMQNPLPTSGRPKPTRICLAEEPIDSDNPFLYHKTTERKVYETARESVAGCDDVLLWNSDGYITETRIANVIVKLDDKLVTPSVSCGLLPGTYRQHMLDNGRVFEQNVHVDDLSNVEEVTLINSVRGQHPAQLVGL